MDKRIGNIILAVDQISRLLGQRFIKNDNRLPLGRHSKIFFRFHPPSGRQIHHHQHDPADKQQQRGNKTNFLQANNFFSVHETKDSFPVFPGS